MPPRGSSGGGRGHRTSASSPFRAEGKSSLPDSAPSARCVPQLGFRFQLQAPFGYDRTADMQDDSADAFKSRVLLAIFERPPKQPATPLFSGRDRS